MAELASLYTRIALSSYIHMTSRQGSKSCVALPQRTDKISDLLICRKWISPAEWYRSSNHLGFQFKALIVKRRSDRGNCVALGTVNNVDAVLKVSTTDKEYLILKELHELKVKHVPEILDHGDFNDGYKYNNILLSYDVIN